ncbi:hypothetical protein [Taibaiella sp. KBW10]|uniref:hypothetical protein n=1 Tax=Taibaiella sp. KBW10 TaxID=2153357 RepID=UPI000F5A414A|nr:hypothetical protein [Taibaiella sp. KBW10]
MRSVLLFIVAFFFKMTPVSAQVTNIILSPTGSYCQAATVSVTFTVAGLSLIPTTTIEITDNANTSLATLYTGTGLLNLGGGQFSISVTIPSTAAVVGTNRKFKISYSGILGSGTGNSSTFTIYATTVGGSVTAAQTICSGTAPANLSLSGQTGSVLKWQQSSTAAFTTATDIAVTAATLPGATIGPLSATTYFRAVVQNGTCAIVNSTSVAITVNTSPAGSLATVITPLCKGQQVQLRFNASQGTGPFALIINGNTYSSIASGTAFNVNPNVTATTLFNLTKITAANGCAIQNP